MFQVLKNPWQAPSEIQLAQSTACPASTNTERGIVAGSSATSLVSTKIVGRTSMTPWLLNGDSAKLHELFKSCVFLIPNADSRCNSKCWLQMLRRTAKAFWTTESEASMVVFAIWFGTVLASQPSDHQFKNGCLFNGNCSKACRKFRCCDVDSMTKSVSRGRGKRRLLLDCHLALLYETSL